MENLAESLKHDLHHIDKYKAFCDLYEIENFEQFVKLYDIYELVAFLPANPTADDKKILNSLNGTHIESGYTDYQRSNNTFELIMLWQEKKDDFVHTNPFIRTDL
jgi:hypothetical protein